MAQKLAELARELVRAHPAAGALRLDLGGVHLQLRSSSTPLLDGLRAYFGELVSEGEGAAQIHVAALQAAPLELPFELRPWPREPGKTGLKESFADVPEGRVIRKTQSGLCFLLLPRELIIVGPCVENLSQVINGMLSQHISRLLHHGWSLCHAAAVAESGRGLGIAARAGAGKSTLALHLMSRGLSFVSNDRLLLRASRAGAEVTGVPKMPRVNAGTLLHNPALASLLPEQRRSELSRLAPAELWNLEEKYDVSVHQVYGRGHTLYRVPLAALLILDWRVEAARPTRFAAVRLEERPDLLGLLMKAPGVLHRDAQGRAADAVARPEPGAYLRALARVPVIEATGRVDFELAESYCQRLLES